MIEPDSFLIIWCDGMSSGLHTNFKLAAEGEQIGLLNSSLQWLDSLSYVAQESNISMGRVCDGCNDWVFFTDHSAGKTNTGQNYEGLVQNVPYFYPAGKILDAPQNITIENIFPGIVRYTLDGTEPNAESTIYTGPIWVDKHTIIRARIFNGEKIKPGRVITQSYFLRSTGNIGKLPVVSLVSDPENFWDPAKGIYVQSFKPDWEIPVNIELFENDGSDRAGFNLQAGTKVNGLYSWQLPQKMLGIYFRKKYGEGNLDYPLFFDKKATKYDSFALRASGSDWAYTLFRDGMMQLSTQINMDNEVQGFRPCVVFINGQYMGIHNIRSKVDADFIINEKPEAGTDIDMIENESIIEEGNIDSYLQFKNTYKNDLSIQENFDSVAKLMDITNFMDFMITEIYGGNTSIGHNVMTWKPRDFGFWRWILVDLDRTMFDPTDDLTSFFLGKTVYPFSNLMQNAEFKEKMSLRLADQLFCTFNPQRISTFTDRFAENIRDELPRHISRWQGTSSSYGNPIPSVDYWERRIAKMKVFAFQRNAVLLDDWKQYGLSGSVRLNLANYPENAGTIRLNGLVCPLSHQAGLYPSGKEIKITAETKTGYRFRGWKQLRDTALIIRGDLWKYFDKGAAAANWNNTYFDDSGWSTGRAEFGYGDGDEQTRISFGSSSSSKYPAYYFRKTLNIENLSSLGAFRMSVKADDGAVVYINGIEVARLNMMPGDITYQSLAADNIPSEKLFSDFTISKSVFVPGENLIAVEIHQNALNSSDVSFDMDLTASSTEIDFISYSNDLVIRTDSNITVMAVYEDVGWCFLPEKIEENLKLRKACSPYFSRADVTVAKGITLSSEPGVEIRMAPKSSLVVNGSIDFRGTATEKIVIRGVSDKVDKAWGAILLENTTDTCFLHHIVIEDASKGNIATRQPGALSAFHSTIRVDHAEIVKVNNDPIAARYSDIHLTNSKLQSAATGDLINVKYGRALIDNCSFRGGFMPDMDAIDYDDVTDGIIRNSTIHDFHGFNSDAIDIGENAKNVLIENLYVYNISDKGVSVGQQSSVSIKNSTFINCNLGIAAKDSSRVNAENITFYGCMIPVAAYEKNVGSAGGNTSITKSIFSNVYDTDFLLDNKSTLKISNSFSEGIALPGTDNLTGDVQFVSPNNYNLTLKAGSPAMSDSIIRGAIPVQPITDIPAPLTFTALYVGNTEVDDPEFIIITNHSDIEQDISGYNFSEGISVTFPEGTKINANEKLVVTNKPDDVFWQDKTEHKVMGWHSGRLDNSGEKITFSMASGIIIDQIKYQPFDPWPSYLSPDIGLIRLKNNSLANHSGFNWEKISVNEYFEAPSGNINPYNKTELYPNPANQYFKYHSAKNQLMTIMNAQGQIIKQVKLDTGENTIDVSNCNEGIYLISAGVNRTKLIISR